MVKTTSNIPYIISQLNNRLDIPVENSTRLTLQFATKINNAWATPAVIAVRCSIDNQNIVEFPSTVTVSATGLVYLDVTNVNYVHLMVTTVEGTASTINVSYRETDFDMV